MWAEIEERQILADYLALLTMPEKVIFKPRIEKTEPDLNELRRNFMHTGKKKHGIGFGCT